MRKIALRCNGYKQVTSSTDETRAYMQCRELRERPVPLLHDATAAAMRHRLKCHARTAHQMMRHMGVGLNHVPDLTPPTRSMLWTVIRLAQQNMM